MSVRLRAVFSNTFIGLNLLTAIAFILSCYVSWFNPVRFWYLGVLNIGSFYLLAALIAFLIFWLIVKKRVAWISIVTLLLCWNPIRNMFPVRIPSSFNIEKNDSVLRVMSWNVEHFDILEHKTHPERKQEMIDLINKYQPDVACFQEMVGGYNEKRAINYVPDIMKRLGMAYDYFSFNPKDDFDENHHFGIIIFSKYPIINKERFTYPPYNYNSIFQFADVVKNGDTFRLFNVHLQSLRFSSRNLRYIDDPQLKNSEDIKNSKAILYKFKIGFIKRKAQSEHVRKQIENSPYPVIVCGDFNDLPNSYAYNTIGKGMRNAFVEKGWGVGRTFSGISPTLRIDNIFVDKVFRVNQFIRIKKKLSDHFPIIADISREK